MNKMVKPIILIIFLLVSIRGVGQSNGNIDPDFDKVYSACKKAQSSLNGGSGSPKELKDACDLMNSVKWNNLNLQKLEGSQEVSMTGHFVFLPEFWKDLIKSHKVYKKALEYQNKSANKPERGGSSGVQITTKAIKARSAVKYGFKCYGVLDIALVSEVNGLVSWKIIVLGNNGEKLEIKDNNNEFKGMPYRYRKLQLGNRISSVIVEILNTTNKDTSCAIIVNKKI